MSGAVRRYRVSREGNEGLRADEKMEETES